MRRRIRGHRRGAVDGDAAVEVQGVVEPAERAAVPPRHPPGHAERAARRHRTRAAPIHTEAGAVPGGHREDLVERVALVEEQHLARDVDLDAGGATTGNERARRAGREGLQKHVVGGPAGAGHSVHFLECDHAVGRVAVEHTVDRAHVIVHGVESLLEVEHDLTTRAGPEPGQRLGHPLGCGRRRRGRGDRGRGRGRHRRRGGAGATRSSRLGRRLPAARARARGHRDQQRGRQQRGRQPAIVSGCLRQACLQGNGTV